MTPIKTDFENAFNRSAEALNAIFALVLTVLIAAGQLVTQGLESARNSIQQSRWVVPGL